MKNKKMIDILQSKNIVIPLYLYRLYNKMNIKLEEFIFLMYLYNQGNKILFDLGEIENDLGLDVKSVMSIIDRLTSNKLIRLDVVKNDKNVSEEYISLDDFYQKISLLIMEDINNKDNDNDEIFTTIEKEFARTLSPIEYEIVKAWLESGISEELIKEALKEATFNGVSNLRYIDKILYEWGKKGIKNKEDVEKNRNNKKINKDEKLEVFEYNWLDDDE